MWNKEKKILIQKQKYLIIDRRNWLNTFANSCTTYWNTNIQDEIYYHTLFTFFWKDRNDEITNALSIKSLLNDNDIFIELID
jgi:hypothetical protein